MKKKKVFILVGHPDSDSSASFLADAYEEGAKGGGHEVRRMNIWEMQFDPILHKGYKEIQELEPDLLRVQENFRWAEHIVILYPNWWCTMPAILKGMFDRMYLPGFAFNFKKDKRGERTGKITKLLSGKSARVVITVGTHPLIVRFLYGDFTNEIARGILGFAGISPVRVTALGPCDNTPESKRKRWREKVRRFGKNAQ